MASKIEQGGGITKISNGLSAGQIYQGMSCENLVFKNIIANNVGTSQILTITQNSQSLFLTTNLSTSKTGTEDIYYVDDLYKLQQLTDAASTFGLQVGDLAWVESESAYYRWNGTAFVLYTPDTQFGTPGGPEFAIQFHTGSVGATPGNFSGSGNFTYDYVNNRARLTGSLIVTGSSTLTGSLNVRGTTTITGSLLLSGAFFNDTDIGFNNINNDPASYQPRMTNPNLGTSSGIAFYVESGDNTTDNGTRFYINPLHGLYKSPTAGGAQTYYSGGLGLILTPSDFSTTRPMKYLSALVGTTGASSFEWHYFPSFNVGAVSLKMKLDVPSGVLSNSGSIVTSGSLTIASGSTNTSNDCAIYFGTSGSAGSWRIAPSGDNLVIQKWNGTSYSGGTTITPTS